MATGSRRFAPATPASLTRSRRSPTRDARSGSTNTTAGVYSNVTAANRPLVRAVARRLMREYGKRRIGDVSLGVLAAWTADQYVLDHKRSARDFLAADERAGRLRSPWKVRPHSCASSSAA